jgi:hypothetical protein
MYIKFFKSGILNADSELSEEEALKASFYNKVYYENGIPVKSEFIKGNTVSKAVYFNQDPRDPQLVNRHKAEYGQAELEVCDIEEENGIHTRTFYYFNEDYRLVSYNVLKGEKEWYWDEETIYSGEGEKWEFIKYIYEGDHDLVKEIHYKPDGSVWYELDQNDPF